MGKHSKLIVKTISRRAADFTRERKDDAIKEFRNLNPQLHPFEKAREVTRALNAVKLDKVFAKPFIGSLDGHKDGVCATATIPSSVAHLASGSYRQCLWHTQAHEGFVKGLACDMRGQHLLSCSSDQSIKIWPTEPEDLKSIQPISTYLGDNAFTSIDHQWNSAHFASGSVQVDLWDFHRSEPLHSLKWGADSIYCVKYNKVERNVLASTASDRSVVLYDVRAQSPIKKAILQMSSNALCWNPMEAFVFSVANEDQNCYTFDMRNLKSSLCVHQDHVSAVMSIDYSPTGKEFVTGSYDRTVRIFGQFSEHSREVYHTRRMQRVFTVNWSLDNRFVISGSDDFNLRVWKAQASKPLKALVRKEEEKLNYYDKLKQRYQHIPMIRRIAKHRHVPKPILAATKAKIEQVKKEAKKEKQRVKHSAPGAVTQVKMKQRQTVTQFE